MNILFNLYQFIKKNYFLAIITILILLNIAYFSGKKFTEKIRLYANYQYVNKAAAVIVAPLRNLDPDDIEDTYGAPRPGGRVHEGIDLFAPRGTPVYAVANGMILYKGRDNLGGNVIKLLGNDNRIYYYAHLLRFADIEPGDEVRQAQLIGYVGNSGNAFITPAHLHFEIMVVRWLFPFVYGNINPYPELITALEDSL